MQGHGCGNSVLQALQVPHMVLLNQALMGLQWCTSHTWQGATHLCAVCGAAIVAHHPGAIRQL
jgi:hypothetical protein